MIEDGKIISILGETVKVSEDSKSDYVGSVWTVKVNITSRRGESNTCSIRSGNVPINNIQVIKLSRESFLAFIRFMWRIWFHPLWRADFKAFSMNSKHKCSTVQPGCSQRLDRLNSSKHGRWIVLYYAVSYVDLRLLYKSYFMLWYCLLEFYWTL